MKKLFRNLYVQVLAAVLLGAALGALHPASGTALKPLGDGFLKLVKMLIAPIVFATVATGIARMGDLRKVGRVGLKGLAYFEAASTAALAIGLAVGHLVRPGEGLRVDPASLDPGAVAAYTQAPHPGWVPFLLNVIPRDVADAFARGDILQVLLFSVLFGVALALAGCAGEPVLRFVDALSRVLFRMVALVMRLAPLGAFGAMAFTVGKFGLRSLLGLGQLVGCFYLASALFVFGVLGLVLRGCGLNPLKFLRFLKEEILIVAGTSTSESALPLMLVKLERLGCSRPVAGLVLPLGYSFNLDGTSIYLTLAVLFIAQATGTPLSFGQQLEILALLLLTSKGSAAVAGGGFITLAATLSAVGDLPVAGLTLLLGVDRFMSEARALTNLIGNGVASVAISRWEGDLDLERARAVLDGPPRNGRQPVKAGAPALEP